MASFVEYNTNVTLVGEISWMCVLMVAITKRRKRRKHKAGGPALCYTVRRKDERRKERNFTIVMCPDFGNLEVTVTILFPRLGQDVTGLLW